MAVWYDSVYLQRGSGSMVRNKYTDLSDSPEGLFIDECGV